MKLLKQIETLFGSGTAGGVSDGQLLERFLERRDETAEAAFAALVDRHGAMVLRVCRRVLADEHDAEDAAQATFLVLARKAGSIGRRESVACWLHGVAIRVAARARLAAARRQARERRGGEIMAANQAVRSQSDCYEDIDRWIQLHTELDRLPESFRSPVVLCYLEGLSQEQAAAQLRCPLGTIQSRLARGRAKLRTRLGRTGVDPSAFLFGPAGGGQPFAAAPEAWSEATVRLALQFAHGKSLAITVGGASAALAEEVLRAIVLTKLKVALGTFCLAALLATGAATWARHEWKIATSPVPVIEAARLKVQPDPAPQQRELARPGLGKRTVRGIVRDEQGRPVAKAWVGSCVSATEDRWELVRPEWIRESAQPFRDGQGRVIPPGALGKYLDLREESGIWQPIQPADVRRHDPTRRISGTTPLDELFGHDWIFEAMAHGQSLYELRTGKAGWKMEWFPEPALRTDADGRFEVNFTMLPWRTAEELHFATPDFTRQAVHVIRSDHVAEPLSVTLRPARPVRARLVQTPVDRQSDYIAWDAFALDAPGGSPAYVEKIGGLGVIWADGPPGSPGTVVSSPEGTLRLEVRLAPGRYRIAFESEILAQVVDVVVPAGEGPLDLPDIQLETQAWVKMLGKPAAEIAATDLDGNPVRLTDYRDKVVLLRFWSTRGGDTATVKQNLEQMVGLIEIQKNSKRQPVVILALHDASVTTLPRYREALQPLRSKFGEELPIHFLLDHLPIGAGQGPYSLKPGEPGSGRTFDMYGIGPGSTLVIDRPGTISFALIPDEPLGSVRTYTIGQDGSLVRGDKEGKVEEGEKSIARSNSEKLIAALMDQFGLPKSHLNKPVDAAGVPSRKSKPMVLQGTVVGLDGRPVAGAVLTEDDDLERKNVATTGTDGGFRIITKETRDLFALTVTGHGVAAKRFSLWNVGAVGDLSAKLYPTFDATGLISRPLIVGPGAAVSGQVVRDHKPMPGVNVGLKYRESRRARHTWDPRPTNAAFSSFPTSCPKRISGSMRNSVH